MSRDQYPVIRAPSPSEEYTWIHRAFLQAFMTHNVLTTEKMKTLLATIITASNPERPFLQGDITQPHLTATVQTINAKLDYYDYEIRNTKHQQTKDTTYAFVNKTSDSLTQLATRFTPSEIGYVRRLLDYMFDTNNTRNREVMAIKHLEASQLARTQRSRQSQAASLADDAEPSQSADPGITIAEADSVLDVLVNDAFFTKSRAGYFSLAPRGLMELGTYLKEMYNETAAESDGGVDLVRIHDCEGCREIVTFGVRCNDRECAVRWHDACANSYYRGRPRDQRACPKCGTVCGGDVYVGERADMVRSRGRPHAAEREEDD